MTDRPNFNGNNTALALTIGTLLDLDEKGVVTSRLNGLARQLLTASAERLNESVKREALFKKFVAFVEQDNTRNAVEHQEFREGHGPSDQREHNLRVWLKELNKAFSHG